MSDAFQNRALTWKERLNWRVMRAVNESPLFKRFSVFQNDLFQRRFVRLSEGNNRYTEGVEHLPQGQSFILAANHRTLFDFYVVAERIWPQFKEPPELCCPVKASFWYETLSGLLLNLTVCGGAMYPPIFRKDDHRALNRQSVDCMVQALRRNDRTILAIHPEGKRNQNGDPYELLPPKPGIGHIAMRARAPIVPCFVAGLKDSYPQVIKNAFDRHSDPIRVFIGAPVDYSDLCCESDDPKLRSAAAHQIAERVMQAIAALGERDRAFMDQRQKGSRI